MSSHYYAQVFYGVQFPGGCEEGDEEEAMEGLNLGFPMYGDEEGMVVIIKESLRSVVDMQYLFKPIPVSLQTEEWNRRLDTFIERTGRTDQPTNVGWFFSCQWS